MDRLSRRGLLGGAAAASALYLSGRSLKGSSTRGETLNRTTENASSSEAMDAALVLLGKTGPEYHGGLSNHGPMASEALVRLGRPEAVVPWVETYRRSLMDHPQAGASIGRNDWREALGDYRRAGDWSAFFLARLDEGPWESVLSHWCGNLAPGLAAAAFHGLIRTAHAARSLAGRDLPARRVELAEGLAYWAARYERLPEAEGSAPHRLLPSQAISSVEVVPPARRGTGNITDRLRPLFDQPSFARVAGLVETGGDAGRVISDLTETFAGVFLAHAAGGSTIGLVHAVTGPSAVRLLMPHVDLEVTRRMIRYSWQTAAAIYATTARPAPDTTPKPQPASRGDLIDRAIATGDEHAFKFTEACLREHALNPKPVYLEAALDAVKRLGS